MKPVVWAALAAVCGAFALAAPAAAADETALPAASEGTLPFAAVVKENGKTGVVNGEGKLVVPAQYDKAALSFVKEDDRAEDLASEADRKSLIEVRLDGLSGFYDRTGKMIVPPSYKNRSLWKEERLAVEENGRIGFYSRDGKEIAPPKYKKVSDFQEGMAIVQGDDGKYGFIDLAGKETVPLVYSDVRFFNEGLAAAKKDGKWGAVDAFGRVAVPFLYEETGPSFSSGLLAVKMNSKWGFVDKTGSVAIPLVYRNVKPLFREGLTAVETEDRKWGFMNDKGVMTASPRFKDVLTPFSEGLAGVLTREGKAYAEPDGCIAFSADFDRIYAFKDGVAEYRRTESSGRLSTSISIGWGWGGRWHAGPWGPWGWWPMWRFSPFFYDPWYWDDWYGYPQRDRREVRRGYLDHTGKILAGTSLDHVYPITKKGILVENDGRYGWIDRTGQYVVHTEYKDLVYIEEADLFMAKNLSGKWGLLSGDRGGETVPFLYEDMNYAGSKLFTYKDQGKWGILSAAGQAVTPAVYKKAGHFADGLIPVKKTDNTWVYLDETGKEALTFKDPAEDVTDFSNGRAGIRIKGKWALIDTKGEMITPPRFDSFTIL